MNISSNLKLTKTIFALIISTAFMNSSYADSDQNLQQATSQEMTFLTIAQDPDSLKLLPPPQSSGASFMRDKAAYAQGKKLRNTQLGKQAIIDGDLSDNNLGKPFSAALGVDISQKNTPYTYALLKKVSWDSGDLATRTAKNHYMRVRPFVYFNQQSCRPQDEAGLRKNGSYPSGHTAIGWATALILSEIRPEQQQELLKRGYDFGQSRVICGAHWQSDVDAGRIMGAAVVARLHADHDFILALAKSKTEINSLIKK
jgi:acid phosphatase (class A)